MRKSRKININDYNYDREILQEARKSVDNLLRKHEPTAKEEMQETGSFSA